jgi:SprT protein
LNQAESTLSKYLSPRAALHVVQLQKKHPFNLRITKPRNSKHGDYKYELSRKSMASISVNGNLNEQAFLFTFLHEYAHHLCVIHHGSKVKAHGREWKNHFAECLKQAVEMELFTPEMCDAILSEIGSLKASTMGNLKIYKTLRSYDQVEGYLLQDLEEGDHFKFRDRFFVLGKKRRTRYICSELKSGKQYLFQGVTSVEKQ